MAESTDLTYESLEGALARAEASTDAAETHGLICGLLCAAGRLDENLWLAHIYEEPPEAGNLAVQQANRTLLALAEVTRESLYSPELDLQLLLPDDESPLADRAEALSAWCDGFLSGLGLGGVTEYSIRSAEVKEVLRDLAEISRAGFDADEPGEDDEVAYMEIVEYLRMGTLLISEELQPLEAPPMLQ